MAIRPPLRYISPVVLRCPHVISTRRCATCLAALDPQARADKQFCSPACKNRARSRRRRGRPIADATQDEPNIDAVDLLHRRDRQLVGKERTIARLRSRHQIDRDRARAAEVAAAAADRRAERAIESMGRDQHGLSRENAELADALRKARQDLQTEKRNNAQFREVIGKFRADAEQRELAERQVPTQIIRRQWEALAVRIARQASGSTGLPLAGLDQEVVSTWQRFRQAAGTDTADTTGPARPSRPARPATAPRRRNR